MNELFRIRTNKRGKKIGTKQFPKKQHLRNTFQVVDGRLLVLLRRHPAEVVAAVALPPEVGAGGVHDL